MAEAKPQPKTPSLPLNQTLRLQQDFSKKTDIFIQALTPLSGKSWKILVLIFGCVYLGISVFAGYSAKLRMVL
jgi:hypothetical protein